MRKILHNALSTDSMWDVIYYGELGSSLELLEAGYSIDCLMTRYQGVDWSDKNNWGCNAGYVLWASMCMVAAPTHLCTPTHAQGQSIW